MTTTTNLNPLTDENPHPVGTIGWWRVQAQYWMAIAGEYQRTIDDCVRATVSGHFSTVAAVRTLERYAAAIRSCNGAKRKAASCRAQAKRLAKEAK